MSADLQMSRSTEEGVVPGSPVVSPLDLRLSRQQSPPLASHHYNMSSSHHRHPLRHSPDAHMPDDPIKKSVGL